MHLPADSLKNPWQIASTLMELQAKTLMMLEARVAVAGSEHNEHFFQNLLSDSPYRGDISHSVMDMAEQHPLGEHTYD